MKIESTPFLGWPNTLRISNDSVDLFITTDVGPRIIAYQHLGGHNVFKVYEDQAGGTNEDEWRIRGGHRFWLAPEDKELSYHIDNWPVHWRENDVTGEVIIDSVQTKPSTIRKSLAISLDRFGSGVRIRHTATNEAFEPVTLAPWALSVMRPGGLEIIPQPPLGEHPRDLLPNRAAILWPYTDLSDPRWTFGSRFWLLRQSEGFPPTKLGLAHHEHWIGYVMEDALFIKSFEYTNGANYPDGGCNFETFTDHEMLEIESLGPLTTLEPGQSVTHTERWHVFELTEQMSIESEEALSHWIAPFLARALK